MQTQNADLFSRLPNVEQIIITLSAPTVFWEMTVLMGSNGSWLQSLRFCKLGRLFQPYTYPQFGRWWSEWGAMAAGHSHSCTSSEWRCRSDTLKVMIALLVLFVLVWLDLTTVRSKIFCEVYKINVHNSGSDILSWSPGWVLASLWGRLIDPWASSSKLYVLWGADNLWVFGTAIQNHSFQQLTALERHCTCRSNLLSMFTEEQRFLERFTFNEEQMGFWVFPSSHQDEVQGSDSHAQLSPIYHSHITPLIFWSGCRYWCKPMNHSMATTECALVRSEMASDVHAETQEISSLTMISNYIAGIDHQT